MKPRILKKLSKKALSIYAASPRRDFQQDAKRAWIDDEFEASYPPCFAKTPKAKRDCEQARTRVNHVPSIGGEIDYFGEGTEFRSFYEHAIDYIALTFVDWEGEPDEDGIAGPKSTSTLKGRLTGKLVLEILRINARKELA